MLRIKPAINGIYGASRKTRVVSVACLLLGWSCQAYPVESAADPDQHLQLAPIKFFRHVGGNFGYVFSRSSNRGAVFSQQSLGLGLSASVGVSSFFWQPWLASVRSTLKGDFTGTTTHSSNTPNANSAIRDYGGDATLSLLNKSRFPFEARIFRINNTQSAFFSGKSDIAIRTSGYTLTQNYRSRNSKTTGTAYYSSSKSEQNTGSSSYGNIFDFNYNFQPYKYNTVSLSGGTSTQGSLEQGRKYSLDTLLVNHVYRQNNMFSIGNMLNMYKSDNSLDQGIQSKQQYGSRSLQYGSFASLRPERSPVTVTGSVRLFDSDSNNNGVVSNKSKTSNFNLGANYLFSKLVRMYGSVNVFDSNQGVQSVAANGSITAQKGFASKAKTTALLGGYHYTGSVGGSLNTNNITTTTSNNGVNKTTGSSAVGLGLILSHKLNKDNEFGLGRLSKSLSQTLSTTARTRSTSTGNTTGFTAPNLHSGASLSWYRTQGTEHTTLRLSADDNRILDNKRKYFQMINIQASRKEAIGRNEALSGNLTVHAHRSESTTLNISPSAMVIYSHQRAFKVRNLIFTSAMQITDHIGGDNPTGSVRSWDNNFSYKLARLTMQLNTRAAISGNNLITTILFSASRSF